MSKHDHDDCDHGRAILYCKQHAVTYCVDCDEQWGAMEPCQLAHWTPYYPYYPNTTAVPSTFDPAWTLTSSGTVGTVGSGDDVAPATQARSGCEGVA